MDPRADTLRAKYEKLFENDVDTIRTQQEYELLNRLIRALEEPPKVNRPTRLTLVEEVAHMARTAQKIAKKLKEASNG